MDAVPCTAVVCTANPEPTPFAAFAEAGRAANGWQVLPIVSGHDAMITAPADLADALLAAAPEAVS